MNIDIRTLIVVLGITHVIQLVVFIHQYLVNRNYRGVGWWLLWSAVEVLSFGFMLARGLPNSPLLVIFAQNVLLISGAVFIYIGILRFLGRRERRRLLLGSAAMFTAAFLYFLYGVNNIAMRGILVSCALALISFVSAQALLVGKPRAIASSVNFLAAVFIIHGAVFSYRVLKIMSGASVDNFFDTAPFNVVAFLDAAIASLMWTFGFIMLLNQRSQADLTEAKQEVESLFDASPDSALLTHLNDGQIVRCNDGFLALSGYSREETAGKSVLELEVWKDLADRQRFMGLLRDKGQITNFETQFRRKDGSLWWGLMSSKVIDLHEVPHIISVTQDISGLKQAEAEKAELEIRNQQLQKAESLGRMAGAIAHHFNNKLQVVMGNLELALGAAQQERGLQETMAAALQSAREAADMSGLMLTYLGRTSSELTRLELADYCRQSLPLLRVTATLPAGLRIETEFAVPGPCIRGNANQLQQILTQLLTNAWEACRDNRGVARVTVKTVAQAEILLQLQHSYPLDWRPDDSAYACLEVADTGCGIPEPDIKKIFDPFFSTKFVGRGLGLSVVLGLVRAHNGAITVVSAPGRGSTFRVYFPLLAQAAPRLPAGEAPGAPLAGGGTILLVEDEANVRELAAKMLARLGFEVLTAPDGVEALALFQQHRTVIRCVLSDLTMPRMNGWATLTALRKLDPKLPVVLVSGYDEASVMAGDHPEQPQAFVSKPYTLKGLGDALACALSGRS